MSSRPTPPVGTLPPVGRSHVVTAAVPTLSWLPKNYGILHDASWYPRTRHCGGAVAVFCPVILRYQVCVVPIPLRLDNAYTAERYTACVAPTARGSSADPTFGFCSGSWHFADCKGYITAQEGRQEPQDSLQGDLIRECRAMARGHAPPPPPPLLPHHRHLARRPTGSNGCGGRASRCQLPRCSGVAQSPARSPRQLLHAGLQVHDALPHARRALITFHHPYAKPPPLSAPPRPE